MIYDEPVDGESPQDQHRRHARNSKRLRDHLQAKVDLEAFRQSERYLRLQQRAAEQDLVLVAPVSGQDQENYLTRGYEFVRIAEQSKVIP